MQTLQWRHSERDGFSNHRRLIVSLIVGSGADKKKHRSSASLAFVRGIHRWPVNFPQKGPVTQKMFPFDDVLMEVLILGRMVIITGWELCYIYKTRCPYCCQRLKSIKMCNSYTTMCGNLSTKPLYPSFAFFYNALAVNRVSSLYMILPFLTTHWLTYNYYPYLW